MSDSKSEKTVLVVNSDVNVLVLMSGMLENECRVLLAADAESALRLLTIDGLRIDLAVVDRNSTGSERGGLRRRMRSILPDLRITPMAGRVEDGVIKLQALSVSDRRTFGSLLQRIRIALASHVSGHKITGTGRINLIKPAKASPYVPYIAAKVMVAGQA